MRAWMRLVFAFGVGLFGVFYLVVAISTLVTGQIEAWPTSVTIETVEEQGFPSASYVEVTGGNLVFAEADARMQSQGDGPPALKRLIVPVVSLSLLRAWARDAERGEPLDASRFRLFASFEAEQVERLWPDLLEQHGTEVLRDLPPVVMTLAGDIERGEFMFYKPHDFRGRTTGFEWEQVRNLRHGRHFHTPWRFVKNLLIGLLLLGLAVALAR